MNQNSFSNTPLLFFPFIVLTSIEYFSADFWEKHLEAVTSMWYVGSFVMYVLY